MARKDREQSGDVLHLRKLNRILLIHASTAIVGVNVGVTDQILERLRQEPRLSAKELSTLLNKTTRTIERHLKTLREQGRLKRIGSDKAGHWEIIERSS